MLNEVVVENEILLFLKKNILDENVELSKTTCLRDCGIDSFSIVEIILFIERKFNFEIKEDMLIPENFYSVQTIVNLLK